MSTVINHGQMAQIDENGNINVFYPKTFSDDVYVDSNGTTLTTRLAGIDTAISGKTNTAVKGNAESSYRTGNVNITPANIGLGNVNNTADANKSVNYANSAGSANTAGTATWAQNATGNLANALNGKANTGGINHYMLIDVNANTSGGNYGNYGGRSFGNFAPASSMLIISVCAGDWTRNSCVCSLYNFRSAGRNISISWIGSGSQWYCDIKYVNDTTTYVKTSYTGGASVQGYVMWLS